MLSIAVAVWTNGLGYFRPLLNIKYSPYFAKFNNTKLHYYKDLYLSFTFYHVKCLQTTNRGKTFGAQTFK